MSTSRQFLSNPLRSALKKAIAASMFAAVAMPSVSQAAEGTLLVQLNDYDGYEAFYAMYLVDPEGRYVRTLWVAGSKPQFFKDMPRWWKYLGRAPQDIDAITGASVAPGDRDVVRIDLDDDILDAGYKIRIETSVEDQNNYPDDVEVELDSKHMKDKIPGTGYIRYFRYKWDD